MRPCHTRAEGHCLHLVIDGPKLLGSLTDFLKAMGVVGVLHVRALKQGLTHSLAFHFSW